MLDRPLAYHITFGTYGTRLHGDSRGTVDRRHNIPEEPVLGNNESWQRAEFNQLRFKPIVLTLSQRQHAETVIPEICLRGTWTFIAAAAQPDHVHVLLSAIADGNTVRRLLKRWLSEEMSVVWSLPDGQKWWAESGSVKWVWSEEYLRNVVEYIQRQRAVS
jgi:REP element-mobilizing transposase RayT